MHSDHLRSAVKHLVTKDAMLSHRIEFALMEFWSCHDWMRLPPQAKAEYAALDKHLKEMSMSFETEKAKHIAETSRGEELQDIAERIFKIYELAKAGW